MGGLFLERIHNCGHQIYICIKKKDLTPLIIYISIAFISGFLIAWLIRTFYISKISRATKSIEGYLESERLMKEKLQKENMTILQLKSALESEKQGRISELEKLVRQMDADILLLQKSNEETEQQLKTTAPALHELKLKLIEANNTIARYKGQLGIK